MAKAKSAAFAPLFPAPVGDDAAPSDPHHIWMILLADPTFDEVAQVRELLLGPVLERARVLAAHFPSNRPTRLASDMMISQQADIAFLEQHGFARYDSMYVMQRTASDPIAEILVPAELTLRNWKLSSELEQQQYLHAYNQGFPDNPKTLATLKFLLDSPMWRADLPTAGGMALAAFDQNEELVASILVYPSEDGFYSITDDVFVLPAWRGRGITKALIAEGLRYAQAQSFAKIRLEVKQSNQPAIAVYRAMGYETINQEVFLGLFLK